MKEFGIATLLMDSENSKHFKIVVAQDCKILKMSLNQMLWKVDHATYFK
jgi:hypothetical protein